MIGPFKLADPTLKQLKKEILTISTTDSDRSAITTAEYGLKQLQTSLEFHFTSFLKISENRNFDDSATDSDRSAIPTPENGLKQLKTSVEFHFTSFWKISENRNFDDSAVDSDRSPIQISRIQL